MQWFAWIPILTPRLLAEAMVAKLKRDQGIPLGEGDYALDTWHVRYLNQADLGETIFRADYRAFVRETLGCTDQHEVYHYVKSIDDKVRTVLKRVAFAADKHGILTGALICPHKQGNVWESKSEIESIAPTGLMKYTVELDPTSGGLARGAFASRRLKACAREHFAIVRDVYHEHVHHDHGDFSLLPVKATDERDACGQICEQFMKSFVTLQRHSKWLLRVKINQRSTVRYADYANANEVAFQGAGHMAYCKSFHSLLRDSHECVPGQGSDGPVFPGAKDSIGFLQQRIETLGAPKLRTLAQERAIWWAAVAAFFAGCFLVKDLYPISWGKLQGRLIVDSFSHLAGVVGICVVAAVGIPIMLGRAQAINRLPLRARLLNIQIRRSLWLRAKWARLSRFLVGRFPWLTGVGPGS